MSATGGDGACCTRAAVMPASIRTRRSSPLRRVIVLSLMCSVAGIAMHRLPFFPRPLGRMQRKTMLQTRRAYPTYTPYERWPVGDPRANPRRGRKGLAEGLREDFALRRPTYLQDWKAGFKPKTIGASLFLYFACLAPVVAFGGAMQVATKGQLGIVETILSRGVCGMLYATFAGQPMTFIGPTGLTLTFTTALYAWASPLGVPFLPMYGWVGLWTSLFMCLASIANAAQMIRYCTRFTEEVFNSFLGTTYIWTATLSLFNQVKAAVVAARASASYAASSSASALLSVILGAMTLNLCQSSSALARSRYFSPTLRSFLADFGPALAVGLVSALSAMPAARLLADVPRLALPPVGAVSLGRPLLLPLLSLPVKFRLLAAFPAFFLAILFFLDQNITVRTVCSPDNKLKPRATYHLDLLVLGMLTAATSVCGLPWMCAATVESINHIRSMTDYATPLKSPPIGNSTRPSAAWRTWLKREFDAADRDGSGALTASELVDILRRPNKQGKQMSSEAAAKLAAQVLRKYDYSGDGELQFDEYVLWSTTSSQDSDLTDESSSKPPKEEVVETRLSGFVVHAMVLFTLRWVSLLRAVPIAVVNGVFFYLGRKVMSGNQFLERLRALAVPMPTNLRAESESERSILVLGKKVVLTFTGLQLACLLTLWGLKLTPNLGMVFPAAIGLLMMIRAQLLPRLFKRRQLGVLDAGLGLKSKQPAVSKDDPEGGSQSEVETKTK